MPHLPFCSSSSSAPACVRLPADDPQSSSSFRAASRGDSFRSAAGETSFNSTSSFEIPFLCDSFTSSSLRYSLLASFQSQFPISAALVIAATASATITDASSSCASLMLYFASGTDVSVLDLSSLSILSSFQTPSPVKSLAFSPDSLRVFTAHRDRRVRVWSASPDHLRHRLLSSLPTTSDVLFRSPLPSNYVQIRRHHRVLWIRHADAVSSLAAAGDLLFSASWDKTLKVWRAAAGFRCLASVPAHDDAVNAVAADAATVYTASADRRVRAWAVAGGKGRPSIEPLATLDGHRAAVNALALSPDGDVLYSGGGDRTVVAWERGGEHRERAAVMRGHARAVMCLAAAGDLVASGSTDRTARIWQRSAGHRCAAVLEGHRGGVRCVALCRVGSTSSETEYRVCTGSVEGEIRVWGLWVSSGNGQDSPRETNGDAT